MSRHACQSVITVSRTKTMPHAPVVNARKTTRFPGHLTAAGDCGRPRHHRLVASSLTLGLFGFFVGRCARKIPVIDDKLPWAIHRGQVLPAQSKRRALG